MANAQEAALHYPLADHLPAPGTLTEVAPGVRWLRTGLPFALDHINLWLLRDRAEDGREGWAVVDCGIDSLATRAAWEQVFAQGLEGLPVLRVIVTHMHPDHIGLAHWLCERWQCRLWISATDWNVARLACTVSTGFGGEPTARFFALHGLTDAAALEAIRHRGNHYATLVPAVPRVYRRLMDGMVLDVGGHRWQCISGYGHAPEHMALHCAELDVLISGDMVLPRISTNVSVIDIEPEADPLPLYLGSLQRYLPLPAETLVLPSHGRPFTGLHTRIAQLQDHHAQHFEAVLAACAEAPCSATDILPVLFHRPLDHHQLSFAMGEAVAHLHALASQGRLRAVDGADGIRRWTPVMQAAA